MKVNAGINVKLPIIIILKFMSTAMFRCMSIEYEFMDGNLLVPGLACLPTLSEKHIEPMKDRFPK